MGYNDSLLKMAMYMEAIAIQPFVVDGKQFSPPGRLVISHRAWRNYTCPSGCGACCNAYTLVLLPDEFERFRQQYPDQMHHFDRREVHMEIGGLKRTVDIFADWQEGHDNLPKCRHLSLEDGRCGIHTAHPLHCAIELLRFRHYANRDTTYIGTQKFGRGWNMTRIDGEKGSMCEILPADEKRILEVESHLNHLVRWANYFHIPVLPPLYSFRFSPSMLTKSVELSRHHRSLKYLTTDIMDSPPTIDGTALVQMRIRKPSDFVRIEEERK